MIFSRAAYGVHTPNPKSAAMGEQPSQRSVIALVFALMLSSGLLGLHLAEQVADHMPDPYLRPVLVRR